MVARLPPSTGLATIRQPHRKAGQFVFIAVLLHWSKFSCSLDVPLVSRTHLSRFRGTTRRPWQSFPLARRTTDPLRAGNTSALADSSPPRSSRWVLAQFHPASGFPPAIPLFLVADSPRPWLLLPGGSSAIRKDHAAKPLLRTAQRSRFELRSPLSSPPVSLQALLTAWPPLEPSPALQASLALLLVRRVSAYASEPQLAAPHALLPASRLGAALWLSRFVLAVPLFPPAPPLSF